MRITTAEHLILADAAVKADRSGYHVMASHMRFVCQQAHAGEDQDEEDVEKAKEYAAYITNHVWRT